MQLSCKEKLHSNSCESAYKKFEIELARKWLSCFQSLLKRWSFTSVVLMLIDLCLRVLCRLSRFSLSFRWHMTLNTFSCSILWFAEDETSTESRTWSIAIRYPFLSFRCGFHPTLVDQVICNDAHIISMILHFIGAVWHSVRRRESDRQQWVGTIRTLSSRWWISFNEPFR